LQTPCSLSVGSAQAGQGRTTPAATIFAT
jgi:hypothetical protein